MPERLKEIYFRLILLVRRPRDAWEDACQNLDERFFWTLVVPLMAVLAFAMLAGQFLFAAFDLGNLFKEVVVFAFSYAFGFHLATYAVSGVMARFFPSADGSERKVTLLVAYVFSAMLLIDVLAAFLNDNDWICRVFYAGIYYIVWNGTSVFRVEDEKRTPFVFFVTTLVLAVPCVLKWLVESFLIKN